MCECSRRWRLGTCLGLHGFFSFLRRFATAAAPYAAAQLSWVREERRRLRLLDAFVARGARPKRIDLRRRPRTNPAVAVACAKEPAGGAVGLPGIRLGAGTGKVFFEVRWGPQAVSAKQPAPPPEGTCLLYTSPSPRDRG